MRRYMNILLVSGLALPLLAACKVSDKSDTAADADRTNAQATAQAEPATPLVVETPAPATAVAVIQTQPGPDGMSVDLNKAAVTGDVLTVQITARGGPDGSTGLYMNNDQISVIDDATAQRYSLLKDSTGAVMASPIDSATRIGGIVSANKSNVYWFKFPAPPATSTTVSINLPNVAPFDGVTVTR